MMVQILLVTSAASALAFVMLWRLSIPGRDPSFIDSWWAFGIVLIAWLAFALDPRGAHALALLTLASLWGLRLGGYLLWRWRKHGADRRYVTLLETAKRDHDWDYPIAAFLWVFAPQFVLQFIVALPVVLGIAAPDATLSWLGWAGVGLALFGIAFEAIADAQLAAFKAKNRGAVMDRGLWRYSRHPNHFGDACAWWGMYLIATDAGMGVWALPGPLLLTWLLTRVSGAPTIEPHMRERPGHADYVRRTSAFFPLPPRD